MKHKRNGNQGTDWNRRYRRDYELDRAVEKLRNSALILVVGFVAFALAFFRAWFM
jgi:hypothetical protein